jgi:hypothetical protein
VVTLLDKIMQLGKPKAAGPRLRSWQAAHLSIQGDKHVRDGSPGQDSSDSRAFEGGSWAYVVVADGHGSDRHFRSDRGSTLAVATMHDVFHSFRRRARELGEPGGTELNELWLAETDQVVRRWRAKVHADLVKHPARVPGKTDGERGFVRYLDDFAKRNGYAQLELLFWQLRRFEEYAQEALSNEADMLGSLPYITDPQWDQAKLGGWQAKAYGTTVLGVLAGPESLHWVQLGDGAMVQIIGGEATYLVPPPPEALGNLTPSLCDEDAQEKIRCGSSTISSGHTPSAILLATDGVPNSYADNAGFFKFCRDIAHRAEASPGISADLPGWLQTISSRGSGDDVSVALAWLKELPTQKKRARPPDDVPREVPDPDHQVAEQVAQPDDDKSGGQIDAVLNAVQGTGDPATGCHAAQGPEPDASEPANPSEVERRAVSTEDQEMKGGDRGAEDGGPAQL